MTSGTDKLGMSLDEIIKLNKKKHFSGPGSVTSRGTQLSQGRRGGKGDRNYQSTLLVHNRVQGQSQGQGGKFNEVPNRNQFVTQKVGRFYGQSSLLKRYGSAASLGRKVQNTANTGSNRYRGRPRYRGQQLARNRIRLAAQILNMRKWNKQQTSLYWNYGSAQGGYKIASTSKGLQGLAARQRRGYRTSRGAMNSLQSDQILRLQKQRIIRQKLNQTRALKSSWLVDSNSVAGSNDMLTICIPNDLAAKRYKQRSNLGKKFGGNRNFKGGSVARRTNRKNYNHLGHENTLATDGSSSVVDISPEGSIVTTISRCSRASPVGRNQRAGSVIGGAKQNRAVEQYVPKTNIRNTLNLQLQKEIAAIQGKTLQPSTSSVDITAHAGGFNTAFGLSGFKPVPSLTATTLNERFSSAL